MPELGAELDEIEVILFGGKKVLTMLTIAVRAGHLSTTELLIELGADTSKVDAAEASKGTSLLRRVREKTKSRPEAVEAAKAVKAAEAQRLAAEASKTTLADLAPVGMTLVKVAGAIALLSTGNLIIAGLAYYWYRNYYQKKNPA